MYEPELNNARESIETLPEDVRERFAEFRSQVEARTTLPWGEHCAECVWPVCYSTCALYERRADGGCRQFAGDAVRIDHRDGLNPYILKVKFKQWAKFWSVGSLKLKPLDRADRTERIHIAVGAIARATPLPAGPKARVLGKINYRRRVTLASAGPAEVPPDCFVLECFNPNARAVSLTLLVGNKDRDVIRRFEESIAITQGYTRARVGFAAIAAAVDTTHPFEVELIPNGCENTTLYFGLMDFVKERSGAAATTAAKAPGGAGARTLKCIVWDLDNTLWDGVLIEDGEKGVRLRQGVVDVIKATDERGILHSIASKNNHDEAMRLLKKLGIEEYFLFPQISWTPKSESIRRIAQQLNIGIDAMAFVDDQAFERSEVQTALPEIIVIDAAECESLPQRAECQGNVTAESRNRRQMYREQEQRETAQNRYTGDYLGFLRSCGIEASIRPLEEENLRRVYELAQRTNQMNFSGNRYHESELRDLMRSAVLKGFVVQCRDRFGDYGIVGFAVVETLRPCLVDLMFSCRVQAKRVEHAVLTFLLHRFAMNGARDFFAKYRRTERNAPSGKVFAEMGFEQVEERDGVQSLVFRCGQAIPDDGIVTVLSELEAAANA